MDNAVKTINGWDRRTGLWRNMTKSFQPSNRTSLTVALSKATKAMKTQNENKQKLLHRFPFHSTATSGVANGREIVQEPHRRCYYGNDMLDKARKVIRFGPIKRWHVVVLGAVWCRAPRAPRNCVNRSVMMLGSKSKKLLWEISRKS